MNIIASTGARAGSFIIISGDLGTFLDLGLAPTIRFKPGSSF